MSLTDRLVEAGAWAPGPRPQEIIIDLDAPPDAGVPGPCPTCGGRGFLDLIDVVKRVQHEHCVDCRANWSRPI